MKLFLVEFLDLWDRSPTWRSAIIAGFVGLIMVFFVRQSGVPPSSSTQQQQSYNNPSPPVTNQNLPAPTVTTTTINNAPTTTHNQASTRQPISAANNGKKIDPPKTPRKAPIPLDTKVGKYTPEPQQKKPRRNLNVREAPIPLEAGASE